MCLAQGHNAVTQVRLEPATPWPWVKHSSTEQLFPPPRKYWYVSHGNILGLACAMRAATTDTYMCYVGKNPQNV